MGHIRLGVLPKSREWLQVVKKLRAGEGVDAIAASTANAAEQSLHRASTDPALLQSFWLLTQLPLAARGHLFVEDARRLGLDLPDAPGLFDMTAALSAAIDRDARRLGGRTDLGEMAQMAAVESLTSIVGSGLPSLFTPTAIEVQRAIGRLSSGHQFRFLAREFFARLTQRVLHYILSRELANHTGNGRRFETDGDRAAFDDALDTHCWEASRIIETFAGGWYGKNVYQGEGLTPANVRGFVLVAFKKIRAELRKRRNAGE